jgi:hypothetical protein
MSLPNPGMNFTPFDTLPAASLDDLVENIEALAAGSGLNTSAITPEKILSGTGTTWPWTLYTPSWTNLNVGNGTVTAKYKQIGKTVNFSVYLVFGTTTSVTGDVRVSLPVAPLASYYSGNYQSLGPAVIVDEGTVVMGGRLLFIGNINPNIYFEGAAGTVVNLAPMSSTVPFTWAANDKISFSCTYEAA